MTNNKQINYVIIGTVAVLMIMAIGVYFIKEGSSGTYRYTNGNSVFDVNIISESETKIPIYIKDQSYIVTLRYDPASLEDIPLYGEPDRRLEQDDLVVITIDPEQNLTGKTIVAVYELEKFINNQFFYNLPVYTAVTSEYKDSVVVNCDHASNSQTVIMVTLGEETQVYTNNYCIVVMGTDEDEIMRAADRLAYNLLGIME
ncbi:MAG: hypothetical protein ABIJ18_00465 [archaeon]